MSAQYEILPPGGHETYATSIFSKIKTYLDSNPYGYITSYTDTKNTAGSTNTSSKIFLIGATSQAANPQTYSHDTAYIGTDGCLYSGGIKVLTAHQDISGKADKSATISNVAWSSNKLTKTINGTTSDVVSAATILGNLTSSQVTSALGFTPTANIGTITSVKTTAGAHTTINVSSGAANFNVPTKTSHLTNDSGFVTTDTKVAQTATDASSNAEYEILFSETADNTTRTEGARKTSQFTFNPQTNQVTAGHFTAESSSPSGNKTANLLGYDIQLGGTSNTWDGTNTSLKTSISEMKSEMKQSFADYFTKSYTITASSERAFIKSLATQAYSYMNSKSLPFMFVNAAWDGNNTGYMIISSTRRFQVQVGDGMSLGILNAAGTDIAQLRSVTTTAHS